jgi:hypothetical protein
MLRMGHAYYFAAIYYFMFDYDVIITFNYVLNVYAV